MKNNHDKQKTEQYNRIKKLEGGSWEINWLALNPKNEQVVLTYLNLDKYKTNYQKSAMSIDGKSLPEAEKIAEEKVAKRAEEFREKAQRALNLGEHPYVVKVHKLAYDEERKQDFIITDYIEGTSIDKAVKGMNIKQIVSFYVNTLEALQHIHDAGFLHLNLKPDLILVSNKKDGTFIAKLSRLGFLCPKGQSTYPMVGTPATVAPEIVIEHRADERSDLYSMGVMMYQTLTGNFPFKRPSLHAGKDKLVRAIKSEVNPQPPSHSSSVEGVDSVLDTIVLRLLSKKPDERFKNAVQVKKALLEAFPDIAEGVITAGITKASELQSLPED